MAKSKSLDWCVVRLGDDHNWWVDEVSDPIRWDVDGLGIVDPRQVGHLIELVEALRDYGFDQDIMEAAFIPFRIEKDAGNGGVRLCRVKDSLFESDEKLFALADTLDEEHGPYADLLDHITLCRVKMLNDLFSFESRLTVDEVEEEIRDGQNASYIEGRSVHTFDELAAILEYVPAGWDIDEERPSSKEDDEAADIPELDDAEVEKLKNDASLKWDEDDSAGAGEGDFKDGAEDDDFNSKGNKNDEGGDDDSKGGGKSRRKRKPSSRARNKRR